METSRYFLHNKYNNKYRVSYEQRRDDPSFLAGNLYRLQNSFDFFPLVEMEDKCIVHSSDCDEDEYEEFNLLTVVNEHSEVLGLIEDNRARELPNSNIDDRGDRESDLLNSNIDDSDTELPNSNNIDNPDSEGDNVDENDSDGEQDHQHYIVQQDENDDDNNDIENNVTLPQVPLMNFNGDVKHKDFGNGWEWTETDPGSSCGPFIGQPGLLIQPASRTPEGFFNLLFDPSMWTLLAQQTNIYVRQRIQQLRGIIYLFMFYKCPLNFVLTLPYYPQSLNPLPSFSILSKSFSSKSPCNLNVFWHDSNPSCVNCT